MYLCCLQIVAAVREGRRVWDNLRKILLFNLPVNFAQGGSICEYWKRQHTQQCTHVDDAHRTELGWRRAGHCSCAALEQCVLNFPDQQYWW